MHNTYLVRWHYMNSHHRSNFCRQPLKPSNHHNITNFHYTSSTACLLAWTSCTVTGQFTHWITVQDTASRELTKVKVAPCRDSLVVNEEKTGVFFPVPRAQCFLFPSVLWHHQLGERKGNRPGPLIPRGTLLEQEEEENKGEPASLGRLGKQPPLKQSGGDEQLYRLWPTTQYVMLLFYLH